MDNTTETKNVTVTNEAAPATVETTVATPKGPRGYTKHGYPASWCRDKSKTHEQHMERLAAMVANGTGAPFNCKSAPVVKTPKAKMSAEGNTETAPKTKKGRTKAGYPASYLRGGATHEQAMARWQAKLAELATQTAASTNDASESNVERSATDSERVLEVSGVKFFFSQDHYNYILRGGDGGPKRYFGTFGRLLEEVRERAIKATLAKKDNSDILRLSDLITADKNVTEALRDFCAKEEASKSK